MSEPLVSILIPCFNAERFVGEAIESALAQTHANTEVIVVDDGSTDRSLDVIKKYEAHVRWESSPNRGACSARNRAFELSRGDFIQFLDADDMLAASKIETQLSQLIDGRHGLSFCRSAFLHNDSDELTKNDALYPDPTHTDPFVYAVLYTLATNGPLIRREAIEHTGGFRPGLPRAQETELFWRIAAAGYRFIKTDEFLVVVRDHSPTQITKSTKVAKDYILNLFVLNVIEMELRGQLERDGRRSFVARHLNSLADIAHRHGHLDSSAMGFALAGRVAGRGVRYSDVWWKQLLSSALGSPWRAAELLRRGRGLRDTFRSALAASRRVDDLHS